MKQKNKEYFVLVLWEVNVSFNLSGKRSKKGWELFPWKVQAGDNGFLYRTSIFMPKKQHAVFHQTAIGSSRTPGMEHKMSMALHGVTGKSLS